MRREIAKVKKGLDAGVYKTIRLIKKCEGKEDQIMIPFNSHTKKDQAYERLAWMEEKLSKELPAGDYAIECRTSHTNSGITEFIPITVSERRALTLVNSKNKVEDKTQDPEIMTEQFMDADEYKDLIREVEQLRAQNEVLQKERDLYLGWLKDGKGPGALADGPAEEKKGPWDIFAGALSEAMPTIAGTLQEHFSVKRQQLNLEQQKLLLQQRNKKSMHTPQDLKRILKHFSDLYDTDPDAADEELDKIEKSDPNLYNFICKKLDLHVEESFDDDEGEEEEEFEEEEDLEDEYEEEEDD